MESQKSFTLIIVRHGEGFHNLHTLSREELEFTNDEHPRTLNSCLTEKGLLQASLLGERLKDERFDVAITSDLKRATQTAEAIMKRNESIDRLKTWKIVRERCLGEFEGDVDLHRSLRIVEKAVKGRDSLTFRPPGGESVHDLRDRILHFLQDLQNEVIKIPSKCPTILVSSHGLFMDELYHLISEKEYSKNIPKECPGYQNTGVAKYVFCITNKNETQISINHVECPIRSCAIHLKDQDEKYEFCRGGCHGIPDEQVIKEMNDQPR